MGSDVEILLKVNFAHYRCCLFTGLPSLCNEGGCWHGCTYNPTTWKYIQDILFHWVITSSNDLFSLGDHVFVCFQNQFQLRVSFIVGMFRLLSYAFGYLLDLIFIVVDLSFSIKNHVNQDDLPVLSSLTSNYMQRKRKSRRGGPHSTLSLLRKELREGNLQSLLGGSSCIVSSSNAAPDPLLSSFILPMVDDFTSSQPSFLSETSSAKKGTDGNVSERYVILF